MEIDALELSRPLSENSKITAIYLANNRLGSKGMEALCDPIIKHQAIQILDIGNNQIGKEGKTGAEVLGAGANMIKVLRVKYVLSPTTY